MVGHWYYGAVGYADDVLLVAPSIYSMNKMCQIALEYAKEYNITFNPSKCHFISYGANNNILLKFNGLDIKSESKGVHLGHIIGPNVNSDVMRDASYTFTRNVNAVLYNFRHCSYDVRFQLFRSYCTSFYGSPLWNIADNNISRFYISWCKAMRKLFELPYRTHNKLLPLIANCKPIECQLMCRMAKFIFSCLSSQNMSLCLLSDLVTRGSGSSISKSFNYILFKCRFTNNMFYNNSLSKIMKFINASHAPCATLCCTAAFARTVVFEREAHF
jgi:hypothetical protein